MWKKNNSHSKPKNSQIPFALTIAGSDSGGGAGIQADLKAFAANKVFGLSAITAITAQNSRTVTDVLPVEPDMVRAQIRAVSNDFSIGAVKTGMLVGSEIISVVERELRKMSCPLVVDPVMIASSGARLLDLTAISKVKKLLRLATLVTPNLPEAEVLLGMTVQSRAEMQVAARAMLKFGCGSVLLKGGHGSDVAVWDLWCDEAQMIWLKSPRRAIKGHGTGCTLSAHIAARLAKGESVVSSVRNSLAAVRRALAKATAIGAGQVTTPDPFFPY